MIGRDIIKKLATEFHTTEHPNIVREYFQHLFLSELYKLPGSEKLLFKGGTALRIIYGSPRFSEDLDFSVFGITQRSLTEMIENLFTGALVEIEKIGIHVELGRKPGPTSGGYYGEASFTIQDFPPVSVSINVQLKEGEIKGEIDSVASDFVPTYNLVHLPQDMLVHEKIFRALLNRKKARDFYDLYFIMRRGLLSQAEKLELGKVKETIIEYSQNLNFTDELGVFLPTDQQAIIRDFNRALEDEMKRQIA